MLLVQRNEIAQCMETLAVIGKCKKINVQKVFTSDGVQMAACHKARLQVMWPVNILWLAGNFAFPAIPAIVLNCYYPTFPALPSSLWCETDDRCPAGIIAVSSVLQLMILWYYYLALLFMEMLPMTSAVLSTKALKV